MAATQKYSTNLGLAITPEIDQKKDPAIYNQFIRVTNALKILQSALDGYTGALAEDENYWPQALPGNTIKLQNLTRFYAIAAEDIPFGLAVTFYNASGTRARKADATDSTYPCKGYCATPGGAVSGEWAQFVLQGVLSNLSGLSPGAYYYLNIVPGTLTLIPPSVSGNIIQPVAWALDDTNLYYNPSMTWEVVP